MRVSALMAVYNAPQKFLREAIDSILRQTFTDFEFIILDDASAPAAETERIVRQCSDSRIVFYKNDLNLGVAASYNRLIGLAQGEYLAIMNHDDIAFPRRFEKQVAFMDAHPSVGICGTGFKRFGNFLKRKTIIYPESDAEIRALMIFKCPMHHPSTLIRRSVLMDNHIRYDERFISLNDRKIFFDIAQKAELHNLPDVLMNYRLHRGMTTRQISHVIKQEQKLFREDLFGYMGVPFNAEEIHVIDEYLTCGRKPINNIIVLQRMEGVLVQLMEANKRIRFAEQEGFNKVLKRYFLRRCLNAALRGWVSSRELIEYSPLKINKSEQPLMVWLLNRFFRTRELVK